MAWSLTIDGRVFREGDLTIDEAEAMEKATGLTWRQLNPLRSASAAKGIVQVIYQRHFGMSEDQARKTIGEKSVDEVIDMVGVYDATDDLPAVYQDGFPPKGDETSTPT